MHISRGTYRFVLAIPEIGIVLKFPVIDCPSLKDLKANVGNRKYLQRFSIENSCYLTLKMQLFRGVYENFGEWLFWLKNHHPLCQPTYFSLLGLVNIQKYGQKLSSGIIQENAVLRILETIVPSDDELLANDLHHITGDNFCSGPNGLKMFDYGLKRTQAIIMAYGEQLSKEFASRRADH